MISREDWREHIAIELGVCSICGSAGEVEMDRNVCFDCADAAARRNETLCRLHIEEYGYPPYYTKPLGDVWIGLARSRLDALVKMSAPRVIIEGEERLLAKRQAFMAAFLRDHPDGENPRPGLSPN